jgi:hypothetical protein
VRPRYTRERTMEAFAVLRKFSCSSKQIFERRADGNGEQCGEHDEYNRNSRHNDRKHPVFKISPRLGKKF